MLIKNYKTTKENFINYVYGLSWDEQMVVNRTFGGEAYDLGIKVIDHMVKILEAGKFIYRGKPVILIKG